MQAILQPTQMLAADADTIRLCGVSSLRLMERAAEQSVKLIRCYVTQGAPLLVLCGSGNNGGDGFAIARLLAPFYQVWVAWIGDTDKMSEETRTNFDRCQSMHIPLRHIESESDVAQIPCKDYSCIVDALIGVGGSDALRGLVVPLLAHQCSAKAIRFAIDLPTGLDGLSGLAHKLCFRADHTICIACRKVGMYCNQGPEVCGEVHVVDIGIPKEIVIAHTTLYATESQDVKKWTGKRLANSSKFNYGRVCVVAGSRDMPGAAALCANAALRSGAGLVELCTSSFHSSVLPEVLHTHVDANDDGQISEAALEKLLQSCAKADVLVLGCGAGPAECTTRVFRRLIDEFKLSKRIVVDADALRAIERDRHYGPNVVLTPHSGELRHLLQTLDSTEARKLFCTELGVILVAKCFPVEIMSSWETRWNINGNPGMATAGSGDVLAGIMGGVLARHASDTPLAEIGPRMDRVSLAVFVHAYAGDLAAATCSQEAMTASDILNHLGPAWRDLLQINGMPE